MACFAPTDSNLQRLANLVSTAVPLIKGSSRTLRSDLLHLRGELIHCPIRKARGPLIAAALDTDLFIAYIDSNG
jgi:hypothetical protein